MHTRRLVRRLAWFVAALLALPLSGAPLLGGPSLVYAASLVVTSSADSGPGSLRQAISDANATAEADTISFAVTGMITLTSGELAISTTISIEEPEGGLTISGNDSSRIFNVNNTGMLSLDGLTLTRGKDTGGAISNYGTTVLSGTSVLSNTSSGSGGAISNLSTGVLTITGSLFAYNSSGFLGGAIDNYGGQVLIEESTFSHNSAGTNAGAVHNEGSMTLRRSTFSQNTAGRGGAFQNALGTAFISDTAFISNTASVYSGAININSGTLSVTGSTLSGNSATDGGGAIRNLGTLTLTDSTLSNNSARHGGGIWATAGTLVISTTTLSGNAASGADGGAINLHNMVATIQDSTIISNTAATYGGGIRVLATLSITGSTISGNTAVNGGGLYNPGGTVSMTASIFSANGASGNGGGIWSSGTVTVTSSTLNDNTAKNGGGIFNQNATLSVASSTLSDNAANGEDGGGIFNYNGKLTVTQSTVSGNSGRYGGGIENFGSSTRAYISDSTISGNSASQLGGGIDAYQATVAVTQSTISGNSAEYGGGIWSDSPLSVRHATITLNSANTNGGGIRFSGATSLGHTIVAGNSASYLAKDILQSGGSVSSAGFNLIGRNESVSSAFPEGQPNANNDLVGTNGTPLDALLWPLGDYGGPTLTHVPQASSPARNAGDPGFVAPPSLDQRGEPRVLESRIDIGALEFIDTTQSGETLVVNTTSDPGTDGTCTLIECTLREAVSAANALTNTSAISFSVNGTITLVSGEIGVSTAIDISEPAGGITISGNSSSRIFNISAAGALNLDGLTLTAGRASSSSGGAIISAGALTLEGTQLLTNTATSGGGAINSTGTLTLTGALLRGNTATSGGGIWATAGSVSISGSTFSGNAAAGGDGGGINLNGTMATIRSSTFSGNSASTLGGAIRNGGTLTISDSTFSGNSSSNWGGAIYSQSSLTISGSTISGNTAVNRGGAIYNQTTLTISHSTITNNRLTGSDGRGGAIRVNTGGTLTLSHTIVAGNTANINGPDISMASESSLTSQGYNLVGKNDTASGPLPAGQPNANGDMVGTNAAPIAALLGALADNGGTTLTHLPLPGSPAIDRGNPSPSSPPSLDQRGATRIQNGRIDIGAVEQTPIEIAIADASALEGDAGSITLSFSITLSASSSQTITLSYATANGSALAGQDYTAASGTLAIPPNTSVQALTVQLQGDLIYEGDESFSLALGAAQAGVVLIDGTASGSILDDDGVPSISIGDASVVEGDSGSITATLAVTLSHASAFPISVNYATADGSALAGQDYTAASGTLTFTPGQTSQSISVVTHGDLLDEGDESLSITLSNPINVTPGRSTGNITIFNDDLYLTLGDTSVVEGDSGSITATLAVTLSRASAFTVSVNYATADGSALAGQDYTPVSGTLSFAPGQTSQSIALVVQGDMTDENDESLSVNLSGAVNATIGDGSALITIVDDDGQPTVNIGDASVVEGDSGSISATLAVTLSHASAFTVSVGYASADGSALAGQDYTAAGGTLTFAPGQTSGSIVVSILGDTLAENDESLSVSLSGAANAAIDDGSGSLAIQDDDHALLSIGDASVVEGNSGNITVTLAVTLSHASAFTVSVDYASADGSALAGQDYTAAGGTLSFAPGQTSQSIALVVYGDMTDENDESLSVSLSGAVNATIGDASALVIIVDDDGQPTINIGDASVVEGSGGTTTATFSVTLSVASGLPVSVSVSTVDGSALAGQDYTAASSTLTFQPGSTVLTFSVTITADTLDEPDESFSVMLSSALNAAIGDGSALGTIVDDDAPPLRYVYLPLIRR